MHLHFDRIMKTILKKSLVSHREINIILTSYSSRQSLHCAFRSYLSSGFYYCNEKVLPKASWEKAFIWLKLSLSKEARTGTQTVLGHGRRNDCRGHEMLLTDLFFEACLAYFPLNPGPPAKGCPFHNRLGLSPHITN